MEPGAYGLEVTDSVTGIATDGGRLHSQMNENQGMSYAYNHQWLNAVGRNMDAKNLILNHAEG